MKTQNALTQDFLSLLSGRISDLEGTMTTGSAAEKEVARLRRKQLREVQKYCSDRNVGIEDRLQYLQTKYTQQVADQGRLEKQLLTVQQELDTAGKDRDKAQSELKKANMLKDRLQELCRQLQRENRDVMEDCKKRAEEEHKQRAGLQQRFTDAINDVTSKMDQQQQERAKQIAENDALREKLTGFLQQYELQEAHFAQQLHSKDLEVQLANAKFEQQAAVAAQAEMKAELYERQNTELSRVHQEAAQQLDHLSVLKEQNAVLGHTNKELKTQLDHYYLKFEDFQQTLVKSNQMFDNLRAEMEQQNKMRKQLIKDREETRKRLEADKLLIAQLRARLANHDPEAAASLTGGAGELITGGGTALVTADADTADVELRRLRKQKGQLEVLCRTLQAQLKAQQTKGPDQAAVAVLPPPAAATVAADALSNGASSDTRADDAESTDCSAVRDAQCSASCSS